MTQLELLRQALIGMQAQAAGLHATAAMALQLLESPESKQQPEGNRTQRKDREPLHYGEPDPGEMDTVFEQAGASPPDPADGEISKGKE